MKKKLTILLVSLLAITMFSGCAMVMTPVGMGSIYTDVKAPQVAASVNYDATGFAKVGSATASNILGWIVMGDAGIQAAMKNGGITKVHHVDYKASSILGIYATYTLYVYGE
jgi:hypothetical protein